MRIFLLLLPAWALATHGCQWLGDVDRTRVAETARMHNDACEARGYQWPGEAYVECRRQLADERQRQQWSELQMSRQQQVSEIGIRPESPIEPYRPIREGNFSCQEAVAPDGEPYIACSERDRLQ